MTNCVERKSLTSWRKGRFWGSKPPAKIMQFEIAAKSSILFCQLANTNYEGDFIVYQITLVFVISITKLISANSDRPNETFKS